MSTLTKTRTSADVSAIVNFHKSLIPNEKSFTYVYPHDPPENHTLDKRLVRIEDIRGREEQFSLDVHGFQVCKHKSAIAEFLKDVDLDEEKIKTDYYREVEELLKAVTSAYKVLPFNHRIRHHVYGPDTVIPTGPSLMVHIDATAEQARCMIRNALGEKAEKVLKKRCQIINVWRPIGHPVEDCPLAVSDFRTIPDEALMAVELLMKDLTFEAWHIAYSDKMRFYYQSRMDPGEVFLIKCFDNNTDGRARYAAHTAFHDPNTPENAPGRRSIEVRCFVFSDE
jgi:hypothetical protein